MLDRGNIKILLKGNTDDIIHTMCRHRADELERLLGDARTQLARSELAETQTKVVTDTLRQQLEIMQRNMGSDRVDPVLDASTRVNSDIAAATITALHAENDVLRSENRTLRESATRSATTFAERAMALAAQTPTVTGSPDYHGDLERIDELQARVREQQAIISNLQSDKDRLKSEARRYSQLLARRSSQTEALNMSGSSGARLSDSRTPQ